jgi:hypothetical protein
MAAPVALKWLVLLRFLGEMTGLISFNLLPNNLPIFVAYAALESLIMANLFIAFNGRKYSTLLYIVAIFVGLQLLSQLWLYPNVYPTMAHLIQLIFITTLLVVHIGKIFFVNHIIKSYEVLAVIGLFLFYLVSLINVYGFYLFSQPYIKALYASHYVFSTGVNVLLLLALFYYYHYYANQH